MKAGDWIEYRDSEGAERRGRVWSLAPNASVWVHPDGEGGDVVRVKLGTPSRPGHYAWPSPPVWRAELARGMARWPR